MRHTLYAIGAAIAISASSAGAATMSYDVTGSGSDSSRPVFGEPASFDVTASVDRFDESLGTLVGVEVFYDLKATGVGQIFIPESEGAGTVSATASGSVGTSVFGPTTKIINLSCTNDGNSCFDFRFAVSDISETVDLDEVFWGFFIGAGTVDFSGTVGGGATGDVVLLEVAGQLDVRVRYTYDAPDVPPPAAVIPLPAGLPLLLGALGALGGLSLLGRRRT
jgi:hypothetical protein